MFKVAGSQRNRAWILFLPSCGGRRGMLSGLRMPHMIPLDDPEVGKCYALRVYAEDEEDENAEYLHLQLLKLEQNLICIWNSEKKKEKQSLVIPLHSLNPCQSWEYLDKLNRNNHW